MNSRRYAETSLVKCSFLDTEVCLPYSICTWCGVNIYKTEQWGGKVAQRADKLRRNFCFISFLFFLLCVAVGTRMGQLCGRCMQLLRDFIGFVQRMSSDLVQGIKECLTLISKCSCLKQNSSKNRQLYKPILQPHERVTAQEFLQHIERGKRTCLFLKECERARGFILWVESRLIADMLWHGIEQLGDDEERPELQSIFFVSRTPRAQVVQQVEMVNHTLALPLLLLHNPGKCVS